MECIRKARAFRSKRLIRLICKELSCTKNAAKMYIRKLVKQKILRVYSQKLPGNEFIYYNIGCKEDAKILLFNIRMDLATKILQARNSKPSNRIEEILAGLSNSAEDVVVTKKKRKKRLDTQDDSVSIAETEGELIRPSSWQRSYD